MNMNPDCQEEIFNGCVEKYKKRPKGGNRHAMDLVKDPNLYVYKWEGISKYPSCPMCKCVCNKI